MPPATPKHSPYYEIRKSAIQGNGAFALKRIPKGKKIDEYVGEVISSEKAAERYDDASMKRHHTFLFELGNGTCIDAARGGNDSRFLNHSCDPNCEAIMEGDRIFLYARRDIEPEAELVYDYRYNLEGPIDAETRAMYICKCGARRCRGSILAPKKKSKKKTSANVTTKKKTSTKSKKR